MASSYNGLSGWLVAAALVAPLLSGCGAGSDDNAGGSSPTNNGGGNTGGSTSSFGQGGEGAGIQVAGNGPVGGGCAGDTKTAEKVPLDMYIMLDQSGSMSDPPSGGSGTRWAAVTAALNAFAAQPEAAGIGVGIQYFPLDGGLSCSAVPFCSTDADCGDPGCGPCMGLGGFGACIGGGDSCVVADYATPDVGIGVLPGNAAALSASMGSHGPTGNTPTKPALEGAIDYATAWANQNPGHATIVVLATDGDPNVCDSDLPAINAIASAGANGTPKILTFVIGVGGSVGALNGIAAAGGTTSAFMIDQDPNVQQAFLDALNTIQGQALPCAYLIPEPEGGEQINYNQINVYYTPSNGPEVVVPKVADAGACPADGLGWYYDNPSAPTQILLCPSTCSTISTDIGGSVRLLVGCDTIAE